MPTAKLVDQARQLLEILSELERGKAYDLDQLGEHIGVDDRKELYEVARILKDQGCAEIIRGQHGSGSPIVAVAFRSLDFDPGLVTWPQASEPTEKKGGIVDTKVAFSANAPKRAQDKAPDVSVRFRAQPALPNGSVGDRIL